MLLYRVCRNQYLKDLNGHGANIHGGRWNSPGRTAVYTSQSKALAVLETLAQTPPTILPNDLSILTLEVLDEFFIAEILLKNLPGNWNVYPPPVTTQKTGDRWLLHGKTLLLKVPSVIIFSEYNYIINPLHRDIKKLKITPTEKLMLDK